MTKTAMILGATGGFGQALTRCLAQQGWRVYAASRDGQMPTSFEQHSLRPSELASIKWVTVNLDLPASLPLAADQIDVLVHAVNVPYPKWKMLMVPYTRRIIEFSKAKRAHLLFVGNIYNAGIPANGVISADTLDAPVNRLGVIRSELETMVKASVDEGVSSTIMRFGDFFGPGIPTSNWFNESTKSLESNKLNVPGGMNTPHTWAYLPDAALATENVLSVRLQQADIASHTVLPFAGHVFSFSTLRNELEKLTGKRLKISCIPWLLFKVLGIVIPMLRDLSSMRYLWSHDIRMNNDALGGFLGKAPFQTTLSDAIAATLRWEANITEVSQVHQ